MGRSWCLYVCLASLLCTGSARTRGFRFRRHSYSQQEDSSANVDNKYHHRSYSLDTQWFNQTLDHFTSSDNRTWLQRYWTRSDFYSPGGPVLLQLDGEWYADDRELTRGLIEIHATRFSALMFQLEHRFYGLSMPFSDLRTSNLKYLKTDQALADAANFIQAMNTEHALPADTKWIVFGGSYAGTLATWLRLKYPDLVYAAVASSAPLEARLDYSEFLEKTKESLAHEGGQACVDAINEAIHKMEQLLQTSAGQDKLVKQFGLCGHINASSMLDRADFFTAVGDELPLVVMDASEWIPYFCDAMCNTSIPDIVQRYATACGMFEEDDTVCMNCEYSTDIRILRDIFVEDVTANERQWAWQQCAELAWFQTSETADALLGANLPLRFYIQQCRDIFGAKRFTRKYIREQVDQTNRKYGATQLNVTRVLHVHGSLDPWRSLGVTVQTNPESPVILIQGASHCTWDQTPTGSDSWYMNDGRRRITEQISKWLTTKEPINSDDASALDANQPPNTLQDD